MFVFLDAIGFSASEIQELAHQWKALAAFQCELSGSLIPFKQSKTPHGHGARQGRFEVAYWLPQRPRWVLSTQQAALLAGKLLFFVLHLKHA